MQIINNMYFLKIHDGYLAPPKLQKMKNNKNMSKLNIIKKIKKEFLILLTATWSKGKSPHVFMPCKV